MEEMLNRIIEQLTGRAGGPFHLRFILQPTVALILAIRAGIQDAREGKAPYGWEVLTNEAERRALLLDGWKDVAKVFVLALVLDTVYQMIVLKFFYPLQAITIAAALAFLPYLVSRGLVTRVSRRWLQTKVDKPKV